VLPRRLLLVRQDFPDHGVADAGDAARRELEASGFAARVRPGGRVAIGVGSRGIANIAAITRAVVAYWLTRGFDPFIVPAMGSHGAATPEGQADVLARFGITQAEVFVDGSAFAADGVMVVSRVKWHTTFAGAIESGLMKMLAIGMGKFAGAQKYHAHAQRFGFEHVIRTVARRVLASGRVVGGLAIVEDAHHHTATLEAVAADGLERREEAILALAKSWMPALPCDVDVLIVDEMGKNISGTGMDAKVVNRGPACEYDAWPSLPSVRRIFVRDLDPQTHGNALGIGLADVTTDRLVRGIDWQSTRVNALSSGIPSRIRVPAHFATDRESLEWVAATVGKLDAADVTYGWIRNTLALDRLAISSNLRTLVAGKPNVEVEGEIDVPWDASGNLVSPFAAIHR
jgi:hypothetical protein